MPRERTTFGSHSNLAHVWAQQTGQAYGKASDGRMFFEGATIFSYGHHFHIARFVERKGRKCVLFTTQSYSVSTGKHKRIVRSSLHGLGLPVYAVYDVRENPTTETIKAAQRDLNESVAAFARSTPYDIERQITAYQKSADAANEMAAFFGIKRRVTMPVITDDVLAKVRERVAKRDKRRDEKYELDRVRRAAQAAAMKAEYLLGDHHNLHNQEWGFASLFTAHDHAAHLAAWQIIQADKVTAWREGKPVQWDYSEQRPDTMLRIKGDQIQTSRGAEFPVTHGKRAFQLIAECRAMGRFWEKNGHRIPLGTFTIDRIDADGTVHAGCHVVTWPEIEACAKELGLVP